MIRPTFLPVPRVHRVDLRPLPGIGVRLYRDGLSGHVFLTTDNALFEVSPTAIHPSAWTLSATGAR